MPTVPPAASISAASSVAAASAPAASASCWASRSAATRKPCGVCARPQLARAEPSRRSACPRPATRLIVSVTGAAAITASSVGLGLAAARRSTRRAPRVPAAGPRRGRGRARSARARAPRRPIPPGVAPPAIDLERDASETRRELARPIEGARRRGDDDRLDRRRGRRGRRANERAAADRRARRKPSGRRLRASARSRRPRSRRSRFRRRPVRLIVRA